MHGFVRAESSAERAAREAAEAQQVQARDQLRLLAEQNRLLAAVARPAVRSATGGSHPETSIRLSCGHAAFITDPRTVRWLSAEGEKSYHCRICDADRPIVTIGEDAASEPGSPGDELSRPASGQLIDELERLARLHQSKALTDAEFQAAKARLLGM